MFNSNSIDVPTVRNERIYTRVYLLLLISTMTTIILYTSFIERNKSETHSITSIVEYEQLFALYQDSLQCPCSKISIPYDTFVTQLDVNFHAVCTSDFVNASWINYLKGFDAVPGWLNKNDFRFWSANFFQTIQMFCSLAQDNIANIIQIFRSSTLINSQVISQVQFNNQIDATLLNLQKSIPNGFSQTLELIRMTTQGNALITTVSSNWNFAISENTRGSNGALTTSPATYDDTNGNTTCSCATSKSCKKPAQLFTPSSIAYYLVEGLHIGCFPIESLLGSSLSCFYSRRCFKALINAMPLGDSDSQLTWTVDYNYFKTISTLSTRFTINDTLETIVKAMFIDSWTQNISYERFFNACAPNQCTFTYYYRFDVLEVLTTFLSLFSGISLTLRFIVPYILKLIRKVRNRFRVAPIQ